MELHLSNFRCYTDRHFNFPQGVILIDGPSGKGKSTLFQAIKYALYGNVKNVCRYGEKKTSVRLKALELDILRTNIPARVVVTHNGRMYEDLEAQEMINRRFGRQFDITSYMAQKGTSQFFTLSGSEKLGLLEELSLSGDERIGILKTSVSKDIKEIRQKLVEEQAQLKILERQILSPPSFKIIGGLKNIADVADVIQWSEQLSGFWESQRLAVEQKLSATTSSIRIQQHAKKQYDMLQNTIKPLIDEKSQLEIECESVKLKWSTEAIQACLSSIEQHELALRYQQKKTDLAERTQTYQSLIENERASIEQQKQALVSRKLPEPEEPAPLRERVTLLQERVSLGVRILELETELALPKYNDIKSKWEASSDKAEKVKQFLNDVDTRRCVQSCPSCKKGLIVQSQRILIADHQPMSDTEKAKELDLKTKYPLLLKQVETQHKLMVSHDGMRVDLARLRKECELASGDVQEFMTHIRTELDTCQSKLDAIKATLHTNNTLDKQLADLTSINPEKKYKDMLLTITRLSDALKTCQEGVICVTLEDVKKTLTDMQDARREEERLRKRMVIVSDTLVQKEKELSALKIDTTDYHLLMEDLLEQQKWVTDKYHTASQAVSRYKNYHHDMSIYLAHRQKVKQVTEKQCRCIIYQSQLEQLETLLTHIIHAEGVCLEQFIRRINRTMAWYMEQFFPDQSLRMELDSEKECKNGAVRQEICVKLTQHQFPCELKALSGGEYDRCALAFMLTINELSHSPCLILDESISSLDMMLSEDVLEVIKEKQDELRKFVLLVSHQANTGFFDHVISL
jgi:DNA repair exonuclease SbcCD ATPase subunit